MADRFRGHSSSTAYPGNRFLREVTSRVLVKQSGATATTYPISYGSNSVVVHSSGTVTDPGGLGEKSWSFDTTSTDAQVGLATFYLSEVQQGTANGGVGVSYTWATNASGNLYPGTTWTTQDWGLSSTVNKYTTQAQDQYGNVTQVQLSNWYVTWAQQAVVRTYANTYLNSSNYTSLHIVNRLTGSSVTDGTNTSTLSTITYDGDNSNFTAVPGITAHDSAYTCNYGQTGCTTAYRGNPTIIAQPGNYTTAWHDIAGNVTGGSHN